MNSDSKHKSNAPVPEPPAPVPAAPPSPPSVPASTDAMLTPAQVGNLAAASKTAVRSEYPSSPSASILSPNVSTRKKRRKGEKAADDDAFYTPGAMLTPAAVGNVAAASKIAPVRSEQPSSPSASILSPNVSTRKKRRKGEKAADDDAFYTPGAMLTPAAVGNVAAAASKIAPVRSNFPSFMRQI